MNIAHQSRLQSKKRKEIMLLMIILTIVFLQNELDVAQLLLNTLHFLLIITYIYIIMIPL